MAAFTVTQARNIALAAQGLARPQRSGRRDRRHFRALFARLGVLQLDSVNVVVRSHYLPVFARLGPYSRDAFDAYTARSGEVFEYWGHEASLMAMEHYPLLRWRMAAMRPWGRVRALLEEAPGYVDLVHEEIARHGPLTVGELSDPGSRTGPWWGHGRGRVALDWLFARGKITAWRNGSFGRVYDLPERIIPAPLLNASEVPEREAQRRLLELAARHHGIGTAQDLADYYRLHLPTVRPLLEDLAAEGTLHRVEVNGWRHPTYLHPEATRPRLIEGSALLSPFDSLIWERDRTERLFGFRYRIEIYVPAARRTHGYYVLPFLMNGELVARVDVKAHRKDGTLEVRAAHLEDGADASLVAAALADELVAMGRWLGLDDVTVARRGHLAGALRRAL